MANYLPTKEELQRHLDGLKPAQGVCQIVLANPISYARGEEAARPWVNLQCEKHGPYSQPVRLDTIQKRGTTCMGCGQERASHQRQRPIAQVKRAVRSWSKKRGFPVKFIGLSEDGQKISLECAVHGRKEKRTGMVVDRGQICEECVDQSGKNSARYIPFQEKQKRYAKKFAPPKVRLIREDGQTVWYQCLHCKEEFPGTWSNIYYGDIEGCKDCMIKISARLRISPVREVQRNLSRYGVKIVSEDQYIGTHYHVDLICNRCGTVKNIKPNTITSSTSSSRMSCKCTRRIPNVCHDLVFDDVIRAYPDAKSRYIFEDLRCEADIVVPSLNLAVEVKYGNACFGSPDGKGQRFNRCLHTQEQIEKYQATGLQIVYVIIADRERMDYLPVFPAGFEIRFLGDIQDSSLLGPIIFPGTQKQLKDLYYEPYKVRDLDDFYTEDLVAIRERLKIFLVDNDHVYPSQNTIRQKIGYGQRKVDRALGLGRNGDMRMRVDACKKWFGIDVKSERKYYDMSTRSHKG